ncbi:alpha/beta hydrolase fold domain-containing protein [Nocardioides marmoribigeumensis]|uniref:Acetyl esterase n=1 Tax=Nocardioides marmoribigeumensis TaxID=433649 RepID=A0ABU2C0W9_9ACTN|nr:alpha/beta hydrolase fold domain-containing protein [Nocardioides marmoribigeumensis]MDR7364319.1 acetyl esterase [Nocardioides marmoribigeumensis]
MRARDHVAVWAMRATARTVRYGEPLRFAGSDLPRPLRRRIDTRHGRVPVHVYAGRPGAGVLVHLHGGAFLMRRPQMDDWWCRYLVAETGVTVVNVDFDVAPRTSFPVAHEQCHDVAASLALEHDRVGLSGFSSGGGLAASVALQARDRRSFRPVLQVLGCPALDLAQEPQDGDPGMISPALRRMVRRVYFPDPLTRGSAYASPVLADSLAGLPPAVVLTGQLDVLRDDGRRYADRLREAGVEVVYDETPHVDHYFLTEDPARARRTMALVAGEVRRRLGAPPRSIATVS